LKQMPEGGAAPSDAKDKPGQSAKGKAADSKKDKALR